MPTVSGGIKIRLHESKPPATYGDERHFFIDLVFYNRILKCFLLIDLKFYFLSCLSPKYFPMKISTFIVFVAALALFTFKAEKSL